MAISYNSTKYNLYRIFVASGGGTSFGSDISETAGHDLFTDTYQVDDAIYFGGGFGQYYDPFASLDFNIGTALDAGNTLVWEYYTTDNVWAECHDLTDNTNGLTTTGINSVVFPFQTKWKMVAVNSVTAFWVRCRLTAVIGSPTEGGATQTTAIKCGEGTLDIDGYTSESPCTLAEIKTWCDANAPQIHFDNPTPNVYLLKYATMDCNSPLSITGETLKFRDEANSDQWNAAHNAVDYLDYVIGKNFNVVHYGNSSGALLLLQSNTVLTGGNVLHRSYTTVAGTHNNVNFARAEGAVFFGVTLGVCTLNGCRIEKVLSGGSSATFANTKIVVTVGGNQGYFLYNTDVTATGFDYEFEDGATGSLVYLYQCYDAVFSIINPLTTLPDINDATRVTVNYNRNGSYLLGACYFYDDAAGTYTNLTSNANGATGVTLSGEVGDIWYFGSNSTNGIFEFDTYLYNPAIYFGGASGANDYVYALEIYNGSEWVSLGTDGTDWWDTTQNFTAAGYLYTKGNRAYSGRATVNATDLTWIRLRITTKGSSASTVTACRWGNPNATQKEWRVYEKFTLETTVKDANGTALSGVSVVVNEPDGDELSSQTTDVNGQITAVQCIRKEIYFDPYNDDGADVTNNPFCQKTYGDYTLTISKSGYITQTHKITMDEKKDLVFTLEKVNKWITDGDDVLWNLDKTNAHNKLKWSKVNG